MSDLYNEDDKKEKEQRDFREVTDYREVTDSREVSDFREVIADDNAGNNNQMENTNVIITVNGKEFNAVFIIMKLQMLL